MDAHRVGYKYRKCFIILYSLVRRSVNLVAHVISMSGPSLYLHYYCVRILVTQLFIYIFNFYN